MSEYIADKSKKITVKTLRSMKEAGQKIAMLTSYDYTTAMLVDRAGVDVVLIGDSAANVKAGLSTTLPISLDEMIVYARSVVRAVKHALVVCDMPFGSYQVSDEDAMRNCIRLMKETGVDALKLEGGSEISNTVAHLVRSGIPVCGHLGLTPQSVNVFGAYGLRAQSASEAEKLVSDAHSLEKAGVFAIVLEKIPATLAARVAREVSVPVIGIGAGVEVDGQVLVIDDMLGMNDGFKPKFLRLYANLGEVITKAVGNYVGDVKAGTFPSADESY